MDDNNLIISPRYGGDSGGGTTTPTPTPTPPSTDNSNSSGDAIVDNNISGRVKDDIGTNKKSLVEMKNYNFDGIELTENPVMSYYDAQTQSTSTNDGKNMCGVFSGVPSGLRKLPPSFYNCVDYPHRVELRSHMKGNQAKNTMRTELADGDDSGYFRLGSCEFKIPPEFISVSTKTGNTAIATLRSSSSLMIKHSYADRDISVSLVLNGMEQINGYKVDSPFGYPHYLDGLRALLGQFKFTPFVPVVNTFLNVQNNIHMVALKNITVETIEGFPETLNVTLNLQEFNAMPYTQMPNALIEQNIMWDLFNFYIQRNIRDKEIGLPLIKTPHLTNKARFKILKSELFNDPKKVIDLTDDKNYELTLDSEKSNLHMTKLTFATGNRLPKIQMSYYETPTMQFLGGTDTEFVMQFETTDKSAIALINNMNTDNLSIVRKNKNKNGIGFIKIENELVNLTGTQHIVLNSINTSTVPGFPGLYTISLSGTSFDAGMKDREKLKQMRPFFGEGKEGGESWLLGREGRRSDLLSQSKRGLANKVTQDAAIEAKLMATEMYPDLRLPKYSAVDWALGEIQKWREANGLQSLPFKKMPRPKTYIPGRGGKEVEYNGYVDPDFWMTYNLQASDMEVDNMSSRDITENHKRIAKEVFNDDSKRMGTLKVTPEVRTNMVSQVIGGTVNPVTSLFVPDPTIDKVIEPEYVPGYEPDQQLRFHWGNIERHNSDDELIDKMNEWIKVQVTGGVGGDGTGSPIAGTGEPTDPTKNPRSVSKVTGNPFVDLLINRATSGCGYVFGASQSGDIATQEYINAKRRKFGGGIGGWDAAKKWIGKQVWDCSSFVCWGLIQIGLKPKSFKITSGNWGSSQGTQLPTGSRDLKVGDLMYGGGHIVVYIGDNKVVHASSHSNGCVVSSAEYWFNHKSKCRKRCRVHGLEEACKKFLEQRPDFYTDSGSSNATRSLQQSPQTRTPSADNEGSHTSGEAVLGKYGSDPMYVQQLDRSKKEKSKKDRFVGTNADRYDDLIVKYCKPYNLDPNFIKAIMMIESGGNPNCFNGSSTHPCKGLLQLHQKYFPLPNPYDPEQNIKKGCGVLYDYGAWKNPKVGFDKKRWIACFNRGPGNLKNQLAGTSPEPVETLNYYRKFDVFYGRLMASGGKPGSTVTALENGKVPPASWYTDGAGSSGDSGSSSVDVKMWFEKDKPKTVHVDTAKLKNPNAGKGHSLIKAALNIAMVGMVGPGAVLVKNFVGRSSYDMDITVNEKSKIPNGYMYVTPRSPQDDTPTQGEFGIGLIDSLSDGELNFNTAKVNSIKDFKNDKETIERMFVDTKTYNAKGRLYRAYPSYIFLVIDEHQGWCDNQQFWSNYYLYQSALSIDVHEAYDMPISTAKVVLTNTNRDLRKYNLKSLTDSIMEDDEISGFNKFTYEWFGSIINEKVTDDMISMRNKMNDSLFLREGLRTHIRLGYGSNPANYAPMFSGTICELMDDGDLITIAAQSDGAELVANVVADRTNASSTDVGLPREPSNIIAALLCDRESEFLFQLTGGKTFIENKHGIMHFGFYSSGDPEGWSIWTEDDNGKNIFRADALEYDIVKNIYKGNYLGDYIYNIFDAIPTYDKEVNMRFFVYNKTPWDIMKMCEKMNPEFVAYPRPFGMEHRMFFGLPWWQHKYRYERDDKTNTVYEMSKAFMQVNPLNSYQDIIENRIRIDTSNLSTNMIGVYTIGGDLASTPVIMSDSWIDRDKQSTKTIDTTSLQDFPGLPSIVDKAIEWSGGYDNGKHNAIRTCISELIDSWKNTYSGELMVIGAPEVRAWNCMAIKDLYVNMSGNAYVREVVHSLNGDNGYITTVVPGLIATDAMKRSGASSVLKSISHATNTMDAFVVGHYEQMIALDKIGTVLSGATFATLTATKGYQVFTFLSTKGKSIISLAKKGKIFSQIGSIIGLARNAIAATSAGSAVMSSISSIIAGLGITAAGAYAVAVGAIAIAGAFVISSLVGRVLTAISDTWRYDHCINVYPLYVEDRPWVGGASGQKYLYPDKESEE